MGKKISAVLTGLLLIAAAVLFVLNSAGVISFSIGTFWPVILVAAGLPGLFEKGGRIFSLGLIAAGGLLLVRNLGVEPFAGLEVWKGIILPVLLCIAGISIIASVFRFGKVGESKSEIGSSDTKELSVVFGEKKVDYSGVEFSGIEVSCVFGSAELDLRNAIIPADCRIDASSVFGSLEIITGNNAKYTVTGSQVFGSVESKNCASGGDLPTVTVSGSAVFGAVEVK
ncbi:MAG: hypothetical protein IJP10_02610 [Clostridia bacterium]|nr:hypothetical protein [Clostridia bacterium]